MSLINLLNEQKREQEISDVKSTGRSALSMVAIGSTAYLASEKLNVKNSLKKSYNIVKNPAQANELAQAGASIRRDSDALKTILDANKKESLEKFKNTILSDENLDKMLTEASSVENARAFLSSLFDSAASDIIDDSGALKDTIKRMYKGVGTQSIDAADIETVKNFYNTNIKSTQKRLEAFKKNYQVMQKSRGQFTDVLEDFSAKGTQTVSYNVYEESRLTGPARKKYNELKKMLPGKGKVSLVSIDEFGGKGVGGPSVYARIEHSNGRYQNIALHLQRNKDTGNAIIRATENLSTRYTTAGGVIDATKLFPQLDLDRMYAPGGNVSDAIKRATYSLEDHLFNMVKNNKDTLLNFNTRNINQFNDYIRSMSIETPRSMMENLNRTRQIGGKTVSLVPEDLRQTIASSRRMQSAIYKISGLEKFARGDRESVTKKILQYASGGYGGTSGAQTLTSRFIDPFDLKNELVVGHIERLGTEKDKMPTAFNVMKRYGHIDRALIPQTARGAQLYGRPELAYGFKGIDMLDDAQATFGRGGSIGMYGEGGKLLGVTSDPIGKNVKGLNLGGIMLFKDSKKAHQLGLAEGMSYLGGTVKVKKSISKTVNEEGLGQSKLMSRLLESLNEPNGGFITVGSKNAGDDYDIKEFFKEFGDDEGRAILGRQDDRFVNIKNHQGTSRFTLGIVEKSRETGRNRYHIGGYIEQDVKHTKLFSVLAKDTTLFMDQNMMVQKLNALGLDDVGRAFFDDKQFGGKIANTLLTTTAHVEKSSQYLRTQIHGGMRMLGVDGKGMDDLLNTKLGGVKDAHSKLLAEINLNLRLNSSLDSLDQATKLEREASTLGLFFESMAEKAGLSNDISEKQFGMVMSLAYDRAENKKFGMSLEYFEKKIRDGLKNAKVGNADDYMAAIKEYADKGVVIGAASGTTGTPHTDLGRNIAKAEPRFANFLYSSLRSFWGMESAESANYISSLMTRMEGFEDRASGLLGMKVSQESLGKIDPKNIKEQISGIKDVRELSAGEVDKLFGLGQGEERAVVEKLSEVRGGNIIKLEEIGLSKNALDKLYEQTGGKREIFLPGEDTFKGFIGHEIKSTQQTIRVEAEYSRGINDLLSSLAGLKDAGEDSKEINKAILGFQSSRKMLANVAGAAIRGSLSGRILGSGSYMGGGFSFGNDISDPMQGTIFSQDMKTQSFIKKELFEVVDEHKGYVAFMDQQAFLDGMSTYKSALNKYVTAQGSKSVKAEVDKIMTETIKDFFLGMHRKKKTGLSGTIGRNPMVGFGHIWAGMSIHQYDFTDELEPLKLLRMSEGTEWSPEYREHLKAVREQQKANILDEVFKGDTKIDTEAKRVAHKKKVTELSEKFDAKAEEIKNLRAQDGVEDFFTKEKALMDARSKIDSEGTATAYKENLDKYYRRSYSRTDDLKYVSELHHELEAAHERRVHKVGKLESSIKSSKELLAELEIMSETEWAKEGTEVDLKTQIERVESSIAKEEAELASTVKHVEIGEGNLDKYGTKILGGKDVSKRNVERTLHGMFEDTLEDLGREYSGREGVQGRGSYRHFKTAKEAKNFINHMGTFYGLERGYTDEAKIKMAARRARTGELVPGTQVKQSDLSKQRKGKELGEAFEVAERWTADKFTPSKERPTMFPRINEALGQVVEEEATDITGATKTRTYDKVVDETPRLSSLKSGKVIEALESVQYEGRGLDVNRATKEQLMQIKGIGEKRAESIISERTKGGVFGSIEDLSARVKGMGGSITSQLSVAPRLSRIGASEILKRRWSGEGDDLGTTSRGLTGVQDLSDVNKKSFFEIEVERKSIENKLEELRSSKAGKTALEVKDKQAELKEIQEEQARLKPTSAKIRDARGNIDITLASVEDSLDDGSFTGDKTVKTEKVHGDLKRLDDFYSANIAQDGKVTTGKHLAEIEEKIAAGGVSEDVKDSFNRIFQHMNQAHQLRGEHGGGTVRFPEIVMEMDVVDTKTGNILKYSGRMDYTRFGIGDYDADPYQVFFDTDKSLKKKIQSGAVDPGKLYTYGAEFLVNMEILGQGMKGLASRMGAAKLTLAESIVDEYAKEQIVKGIGGLDVQVKAGMMGLAQAAADDASGDFAGQFERMKAGASLISIAQEVLGIKGKKLPIAADISKEYLTALKTSFERGEASSLKSFFKEKILPGTILENIDSDLRIDTKSVKFQNLAEGKTTKWMREKLGGVNLNLSKTFEAWDIMAANVKKHGWDKMSSDSRIGRALEGSSAFSSNQLFGLLNQGMSMEGGVITENMNAVEDIFSRAESAKNELAGSLTRGKGIAGIIAGGLLASYAIGANQEIGSLEPGGKFSDRASKEALRAGQSLSNRAISQSFSREHSNVSPARIGSNDNFYERPINSGETTVSLNRSARMYGEAPSLSTAQSMGKHFLASGGQASLTINDNRRPLGPAYMNKMMRD